MNSCRNISTLTDFSHSFVYWTYDIIHIHFVIILWNLKFLFNFFTKSIIVYINLFKFMFFFSYRPNKMMIYKYLKNVEIQYYV